jgi:hypothetical protein
MPHVNRCTKIRRSIRFDENVARNAPGGGAVFEIALPPA